MVSINVAALLSFRSFLVKSTIFKVRYNIKSSNAFVTDEAKCSVEVRINETKSEPPFKNVLFFFASFYHPASTDTIFEEKNKRLALSYGYWIFIIKNDAI